MSERRREQQQQPSDSLIASGNDSPQRFQNQPPPPPAAVEHTQPTTFGTPGTSSPALPRYSANNGRSMELPPLPQAVPASAGSYLPASRSVGVSSILNPVDSADSPHTRRRKLSQLSSPRSASNVLPPLGTTNRPPPSATTTPTSPPMNFSSAYRPDRQPRRILTPRSPSVHRTASLNQLHTASAQTYSTQHTPFAVSPRSRTYSVEPGTASVPPLPHLPPAARHASYGFPAPTPPPPPPSDHAARRTNVGAPPPTRPPSESTSPRSSYSSHNEPSPAATYGQSSMPTLSASYAAGSEFGNHHDQRSLGVPVSSSGGQTVYQMMTLETTSGTVSLPVDVQAASRVADEKRRRNAGASARFRQRRKEKEKEASTTISRLEQQLKDLGEDMEFYKREREYMAGVILQVPGGERHFPRPQSPRHRRTSGYSGTGASNSYMHYQESGARSPDSGRNVRRRTSTLSLPHFPPQTQTAHVAPGSGLPQSYPSNYGQAIAPQPHHTLQGPSGPQPSPMVRGTLPALPSAHQGPPQLLQATPQTGPYNPYAERRGTGQHPQQGALPQSQHRDSR